MTIGVRQLAFPRRRPRPADRVVVPPDPRLALSGPLDPALETIRAELGGHRRRLWLRRIVRRAWFAVAAIAVGEAVIWTVARFIPLGSAQILAAALPIVIGLIFLGVVLRARPSAGPG